VRLIAPLLHGTAVGWPSGSRMIEVCRSIAHAALYVVHESFAGNLCVPVIRIGIDCVVRETASSKGIFGRGLLQDPLIFLSYFLMLCCIKGQSGSSGGALRNDQRIDSTI